MTTVMGTFTGVDDAPARGYVRFVPTAGLGLTIADLPLPITEKIVDGDVSVELDPSGVGWAWQVTFQIYGLPHWTRYYIVPASGTLDFSELTEVDPESLDPAAEPDENWYAYVDQIVAGQVGRVDVVTGTEARPAFGSVFWIGGTIQPVNMAENTDIWFKANA